MANAVSNVNNELPAYLAGAKKTGSFGDVVSSDIIVPRVKLMQMTSPELQTFDGVRTGDFFHNILEQSIGKEVRIIPIHRTREIVLWAPRGDDRGILARSSDCVNWDDGYANLEFEVKIKGIPDPIKYHTKGNVEESGLTNFGSMIPGDKNSRPAASETHRLLLGCPDHMDWGPFIVINTRSSLARVKSLITKTEMRPVDVWAQVYVMGSSDEEGDEGPYKNYTYTAAGYATEEQYEWAKGLYERFKGVKYGASDESDDSAAAGGPVGKPASDAATRDTSKSGNKF